MKFTTRAALLWETIKERPFSAMALVREESMWEINHENSASVY